MKLKIVDLFSGCGGFAEGFHQENFKTIASVDFHEASCDTIRQRLIKHGTDEAIAQKIVIHGDITKNSTLKNLKNLNLKRVDVLTAGVPCQTFSSVGRAQDKHSMKRDKRNWLYLHYLTYLRAIKPKVTVFENVEGILSAKPRGFRIFDDLKTKIKRSGYKIIDDDKMMLLNALNFGVPQNRKRIFLIGVRNDIKAEPGRIYEFIKKKENQNTKKNFTVRDAIADLPALKPGQGDEKIKFTSKKNKYLKTINKTKNVYLYNHVCRNHNEDDQQRYYHLSKNNWELIDLQKKRPNLVHHDPKHFKNRYTVQQWNSPGRTVVSHLYKDGNLFIHPDYKQKRTFTVREAARIQSFSDDFVFYGSRTNQYIQVGNAVPPKLASVIARSIYEVIFQKK